MYSPHVIPLAGVNCRSSFLLQVIGTLATPMASRPSIKYVKGDTLYMKIQKRGIASGVAITPQKDKHIVKARDARLAALAATSLNETAKRPMEPMYTKKAIENNQNKAPLSCN